MSESQAVFDARWHRMVRRYGRLLSVWGQPRIGAEHTDELTAEDATLLLPPNDPVGAAAWLARLRDRFPVWMRIWEAKKQESAAEAERLRRLLIPVVRDAIDRVNHTSGALLDPWSSWLAALESGAAKAAGGAFGSAIGWAVVIAIAVYAATRKGGR